jgi:hypothetical protein
MISWAAWAWTSVRSRAASTVTPWATWTRATGLIASGRTGAGPVVEFTFAAIFTAEISVAVYRR